MNGMEPYIDGMVGDNAEAKYQIWERGWHHLLVIVDSFFIFIYIYFYF